MVGKVQSRTVRRGRTTRPAREMLVVALGNQKGGVGKTTIALNLAVAAMRRGSTASVLDLDLQKSAERFAELRAEETGEEAPVVVHGSADSLKEMVEAAREGGVELLLLDCPGALDRTLLLAAALADVIVVPTRSSVLDLHSLRDTLEYLELSGKAAKCLVVLNAAREGRDGGSAEVRAMAGDFGVAVAETELEDLRAFSVTLAKGRTAVEAGTRSKAAKSVEALLDEIAAHHEQLTMSAGRRHR